MICTSCHWFIWHIHSITNTFYIEYRWWNVEWEKMWNNPYYILPDILQHSLAYFDGIPLFSIKPHIGALNDMLLWSRITSYLYTGWQDFVQIFSFKFFSSWFFCKGLNMLLFDSAYSFAHTECNNITNRSSINVCKTYTTRCQYTKCTLDGNVSNTNLHKSVDDRYR